MQTIAATRLCYAAAHVAWKPWLGRTRARRNPEELARHIDREATARVRKVLDALGFGIAEAMDTAQRFSLGWPAARELIALCGDLGIEHGFVAGAGYDHLRKVRSLSELVDGVLYQASLIREHGGIPMILPMPWLCERRANEEVYVDAYAAIFRQIEGPLFVHWLGEAFRADLAGYFPGDSFARVMGLAPEKVRGCKLSLLDAGRERAIRAELLARDQIVLTGDDLHFDRLIRGEGERPPEVLRWTRIGNRRVALGDFSHALLGVLGPIARPAARALEALARGDDGTYTEIMAACARLGRHLFAPPTSHYKAGVAFLAWLSGLQDEFLLLDGEHESRDAAHLRRAAELAVACGALDLDERARRRLSSLGSGRREN